MQSLGIEGIYYDKLVERLQKKSDTKRLAQGVLQRRN
jgi:hypothetical protein